MANSDGPTSPEATLAGRRLRPSGGYRRLRVFKLAQIIYDATAAFCARFVDKRSRTHDQMVQAARSGTQNQAEGSRASATSSQTELRLVGVARASMDELLIDYEDFLRQRGLRMWAKDDPESLEVRAVGKADDPKSEDYARWLAHADPAVEANAIICLIHQENYLLDHQVSGLEGQFVEGGGYSERLAAARLARRQNRSSSDRSDQTDRTVASPVCPACNRPMLLRTARKGPKAGSQFWGCSGYPECRRTLAV